MGCCFSTKNLCFRAPCFGGFSRFFGVLLLVLPGKVALWWCFVGAFSATFSVPGNRRHFVGRKKRCFFRCRWSLSLLFSVGCCRQSSPLVVGLCRWWLVLVFVVGRLRWPLVLLLILVFFRWSLSVVVSVGRCRRSFLLFVRECHTPSVVSVGFPGSVFR